MIGLGVAQAAAQTAPPFKVGVATRAFVPAEPYEWRGDAKHALATMIWYPADPGAEEKPQLLGPPGNPLFDGGRAAADAALAPTPAKFPLIVLSHGTGGTGGTSPGSAPRWPARATSLPRSTTPATMRSTAIRSRASRCGGSGRAI